MWVDKYKPKRFSDLLGEDVSSYSAHGIAHEAEDSLESTPGSHGLVERVGQMRFQASKSSEKEAYG